MLTEEQLEAFRARYGKIGIVDYGGHRLVFRKPSRIDVRDYRRKMDSPQEKPDGLDQLANIMICAFDEEQEPQAARAHFLSFLDEYPLFTSSGKALTVLNILSGLVEQEEVGDLGKGVSVRSAPRRPTQTA